jgi:hypothetical protein
MRTHSRAPSVPLVRLFAASALAEVESPVGVDPRKSGAHVSRTPADSTTSTQPFGGGSFSSTRMGVTLSSGCSLRILCAYSSTCPSPSRIC